MVSGERAFDLATARRVGTHQNVVYDIKEYHYPCCDENHAPHAKPISTPFAAAVAAAAAHLLGNVWLRARALCSVQSN
jgi:hypothetical protein